MNKSISQKDMLLNSIMKNNKKKMNIVTNNSAQKGSLNTKGNIDVKAKNRKSQ